jgi:hypothetical protein
MRTASPAQKRDDVARRELELAFERAQRRRTRDHHSELLHPVVQVQGDSVGAGGQLVEGSAQLLGARLAGDALDAQIPALHAEGIREHVRSGRRAADHCTLAALRAQVPGRSASGR